jgi:hypothetical protein
VVFFTIHSSPLKLHHCYTFGGLLTTPIDRKITKKLILIRNSILAKPTNVTTTPEIQSPRKTIAATRNKSATVIIVAPEFGYWYLDQYSYKIINAIHSFIFVFRQFVDLLS